jgi:hypothetical protein
MQLLAYYFYVSSGTLFMISTYLKIRKVFFTDHNVYFLLF